MEISKGKLSKYALLRHKKYRVKEGLFMVQGEKAVEDTLGKFDVEAILSVSPERYSFLKDKRNIFTVSDNEIKKISSLENIPGIIAIFKIPTDSDSSKNKLSMPKGEFSLALDGVQDPGNLGTIIRTTHWFGIKRIYCSHDTVDVFNPKVVMSTMGSIAAVKVISCSLTELIEHNPDLPVYGLLLEGENIFKIKNLTPGLIIMGSEGHGIAEETRRKITQGLTIPASDNSDRPESLNVAIATAITLSQLIK